MKKLIFIFILGVIITIAIYRITVTNKIDVMVIGDSVATGDTFYGNTGISFNLYLKNYLKDKSLRNYDITYTKNNMTIEDFYYKLIQNNEINEKHLQNLVKESEIIIISLGQDELVENSKINNLKNIERKEFYKNYNLILKKLREITTKPIYLIGFYGTVINQINEIENNMKVLCKNNNVRFITIKENINDSDYVDYTKNHLNYQGHKKIFDAIEKELSL